MRHSEPVPLYEYVCRRCAHEFEELVFGGDEAPRCPRCQAGEVERVMSVVAVGRSESARPAAAAPAPCGTCGDPRGPGSCAVG
jgi:putative FmdB family regulatory protein